MDKKQCIYAADTGSRGIGNGKTICPFYYSPKHDFNLLRGDCFELLPQFNFQFDMIFADPPYFLNNGDISVQSGKVVCVNKGD